MSLQVYRILTQEALLPLDGAVGVAPKSEVSRLERKVNQLTRKVRELEKSQAAA